MILRTEPATSKRCFYVDEDSAVSSTFIVYSNRFFPGVRLA
jgi:hypothetical protein